MTALQATINAVPAANSTDTPAAPAVSATTWLAVVGATLGGYPRAEMRRIHHETQDAIEALVAQGKYQPLVSRCVDFADVPAAVTDLAERRTWGRVVVRI